jgi:hypothetical protein
MRKTTVTLLAVLALSCAAFGASLVIQSSGGSWNLPVGTTSFSFNLSASGGCSGTTAMIGTTGPISVPLGTGTTNPTACIFRNAGPSPWTSLNILITFASPLSSLPAGGFTGGGNVFSSFVATPIFGSGGSVTGVHYFFSGAPGAGVCPGSPTCEPDFVFGSMPAGTVTVNIVPEPASLVLAGTGLLFLSVRVRKILGKRKVISTISS